MGAQILETRMYLGLEQMSSHLFPYPLTAGKPATNRKEVKISCISSHSTPSFSLSLSPCLCLPTPCVFLDTNSVGRSRNAENL